MDLEALQQRLQQALGPEFTVGPLLGQGGFAAVFRARDNSLNRDVAVKVLDVELAPSPTVAERFLREAQTVARLEHPQDLLHALCLRQIRHRIRNRPTVRLS